MQQWRRLPLALLALWALIFTLVPQTLWACPITGRVEVAARVCVMASGAQSVPPCADKCCKPLSLPPAQTDDNSTQSAHLFTATSHAPALVFAPVSSVSAPFIAAPRNAFEAPAVRFYRARFTNAPPAPPGLIYRTLGDGRAPPAI